MDYVTLIVFSVFLFSVGLIILIYVLMKLKNGDKSELYIIFIISGEIVILILAFLLGVMKLLLTNSQF